MSIIFLYIRLLYLANSLTNNIYVGLTNNLQDVNITYLYILAVFLKSYKYKLRRGRKE